MTKLYQVSLIKVGPIATLHMIGYQPYGEAE